ncbi:MAG: metallophosphoesterase [Armatimonadota bacterium]|nr:metallophosphoesterase [Armatimonadota bacterium]
MLCLTVAAAPPRGAGAAPAVAVVRAVVFGDINGPYGATTYHPTVTQVVARIATEWRPDVVLLPGDLVAGQSGNLPDARFPEMWRAFDAAVAGPLRRASIPMALAVGNHDASAARDARGAYRFERERDHAAAYWRDPARRPRLRFLDESRFPFSYSFIVEGIFVLVLDASTHMIQDPQWVVAALTRADAAAAGMRIVMGHLPLYGVAEGRNVPGEVVADGERWRGLFESLGVDLYVSGHHAAYYPAHRGALRLLHAGAGVGARSYVGHPGGRSRLTVTVMQIDPRARTVALETFDVTSGARVELGTLPQCLNGHNGPVFRVDVPQRSACGSRS